ncbi:MAG TPA: SurA N-terminal domain-containing protein [Burkholderiales bacterium]|nr:SurA N-terminal domain-containing protein [Burkholderiales bacterium]
MFDLVQKYRRVMQIVLGLIAITFATWGIESYTRFAGGGDSVAKVNGSEISRREFDDQLRTQQEGMRRMFGGQVDPAAFDNPEMRRAVLDQMVNERVVATETAKRNLWFDDKRLSETILSVPDFQVARKFSEQQFDNVARSQNPPLTARQFAERIRQSMSLQQIPGAIAESAIVPHALVTRLAAIEAEQREMSQVQISAKQYVAQVKVDPAQVKQYYDSHQGDFRTAERVRAEYVVLSAQNLAKQEPVTDDEIKQAYEARASSFRVEEQRRASHILVKTKEEADKILAQLKKNPGAFADLAKKHSQDPGSAEKGGDLGWFGHGMMVKPFEEAVFGMKQGELGIAQSEFGFHVVKLTGVQAGKQRPFEEVKKELAADLAKQKGQKKYAEAAEQFGNMVYEQSESLKPVADKYKLAIQTTGWITRSARQELGALDNPKLLSALFSQDAIVNKRNTDAIEVAPNTLVAARVTAHEPEAQRKFEEVKDEIADLLSRQEAFKLAENDGAAKLAQLQKGENAGLSWSPPKLVSRREAQGLPAEVLRKVVAADVSKLPAYLGMPVGEAGYLLLRITKVVEGKPAAEDKQREARVAATIGGAEFEAYLASLKGRADISINTANLEKK